MSSHGFSTVSLLSLFTVTILWLASASVQVGANGLQRDPYGAANGEFLAGYPTDRDTRETDAADGQDRDPDPDRNRALAGRNHVLRAFDSPYGARFRAEGIANVNANSNPKEPPVASKWFRYQPSDRSSFDPYGKRNIDEIDRTAFDNFFKRNLDEIDLVAWNEFANRLANYMTSRASRTSGTHRMAVHG